MVIQSVASMRVSVPHMEARDQARRFAIGRCLAYDRLLTIAPRLTQIERQIH